MFYGRTATGNKFKREAHGSGLYGLNPVASLFAFMAMKNILWCSLPVGVDHKEVEAAKQFLKEEFKEEDVRILVSVGDAKLVCFGKPMFYYPYWILKIKLWLKTFKND